MRLSRRPSAAHVPQRSEHELRQSSRGSAVGRRASVTRRRRRRRNSRVQPPSSAAVPPHWKSTGSTLLLDVTQSPIPILTLHFDSFPSFNSFFQFSCFTSPLLFTFGFLPIFHLSFSPFSVCFLNFFPFPSFLPPFFFAQFSFFTSPSPTYLSSLLHIFFSFLVPPFILLPLLFPFCSSYPPLSFPAISFLLSLSFSLYSLSFISFTSFQSSFCLSQRLEIHQRSSPYLTCYVNVTQYPFPLSPSLSFPFFAFSMFAFVPFIIFSCLFSLLPLSFIYQVSFLHSL